MMVDRTSGKVVEVLLFDVFEVSVHIP